MNEKHFSLNLILSLFSSCWASLCDCCHKISSYLLSYFGCYGRLQYGETVENPMKLALIAAVDFATLYSMLGPNKITKT